MKQHTKRVILQELLFNKREVLRILPLLIFSTTLIALFPLVTQFFIKIVYHQSVKFLVVSTAVLLVVYLFKLFCDIRIQKFENKLFIKLQTNIWGKLISSLLQSNFYQAYTYLDKKTSLFTLFVKKVILSNFKAIIKIVALLVTIAFYDSHLFMYSLFFIPVFVIYVVLFRKLFFHHREKIKPLLHSRKKNELIPFLHAHFTSNKSLSSSLREYKRIESMHTEKELRNRNSLVTLNQSLRIAITFFRILYLAYFGYFIITSQLYIEGLIVGLLFITILVSSCTQLLESLLFYHITKDSVEKIASKIQYAQDKKA